MASTYFTLLTNIGMAKVANAVALNQDVNLMEMAVGDGNGNPTTPNEGQTALVRETYRASINQLTVDPSNANYIIAEMIIPTTVGGWAVNEVGIFDDEGDLFAIANFPATYKPVLAEGSGRDLVIRIIIQVSNSDVVTLQVDPAIILASQAWVAANFVKRIEMDGGTTGQVLVKASNSDIDFEWADPTAAVDVNVFSREETQTLAGAQTIVTLATLTTDGIAVYIEGVRLRDDEYTVNTATQFTLDVAYPAGSKITAVQNEETGRNDFLLKVNNLSDVANATTARANLSAAKSGINSDITELTGLSTPAQYDNDTSVATTAFVQRALGSHAGIKTVTAPYTIIASDAGKVIIANGTGTVTVPFNLFPAGVGVTILPESAASNITLATTGVANFAYGGAAKASIALKSNEVVQLISQFTSNVIVASGGLRSSDDFVNSLGASGYQKLPSGLVIQWGTSASITAGSHVDVTLPIAFPTAFYSATATAQGAGDIGTPAGIAVQMASQSTLTIRNWSAITYAANWIAIGS